MTWPDRLKRMSQTSNEPGGSVPAPLIRASELAQYSFCRRAWWLGTVKGLPSRTQAALERGTRHHQQHGRQVDLARRWQQIGLVLLGTGLMALLAAGLLGLGG